MQNHYEILGLPASASQNEIRRAYRILARRYHPDVNPEHSGGEKFKAISEAYGVLNDTHARAKYDADLAATSKQNQFNRYKAYTEQATKEFRARSRHAASQERTGERSTGQSTAKGAQRRANHFQPELLEKIKHTFANFDSKQAIDSVKKNLRSVFYVDPPAGANPKNSAANPKKEPESAFPETSVASVSIIEVSITMQEAISGVKKTIEIQDPKKPRKVSVQIPPGSRNGSLVRMRNRQQSREELVLVIRVAPHPFMHIDHRGLVVEVPVTVKEATVGASITVPGIQDEHLIKIPPGAQSGFEVRLRDKGIRDSRGTKGDIFYKLMIQVPNSIHAVGLRDCADAFEKYYEEKVRTGMPKRLALS